MTALNRIFLVLSAKQCKQRFCLFYYCIIMSVCVFQYIDNIISILSCMNSNAILFPKFSVFVHPDMSTPKGVS